MSEEMAIESLVKSYWELKGYFVRTRVPYRVEGEGQSHDIDVLCFHPKKESIIIECKAWGGPEKYWNYGKDNYSSLEKKLKRIRKGRRKRNIFSPEVLKDAIKKVKDLTGIEPKKMIVYLPAIVEDKKLLEEKLSKEMKFEVEIISIHELIKELFVEVALDMRKRRKRYPDTALELIRWFNRCYMKKMKNENKKYEKYEKKPRLIDLNELGKEIEKAWNKHDGE